MIVFFVVVVSALVGWSWSRDFSSDFSIKVKIVRFTLTPFWSSFLEFLLLLLGAPFAPLWSSCLELLMRVCARAGEVGNRSAAQAFSLGDYRGIYIYYTIIFIFILFMLYV